ncbi:MAG TPA: hypothetical protein VF783_24025, partial [Terriglobales bacterium]
MTLSLKFQAQSSGCFADFMSWMVAHLECVLSVERLTEPVCLCPRQFSCFKPGFNSSAAFVQRLRLNESRKRLRRPQA